MAVAGYEYLSVLRVTKIMEALEDVRNLPQELKFVNRTPFTPAADNEIVGRWINRVQIADLISDDARALTYSAGKLQLESNIVPNIKHGRRLTQENLHQLASINANPTWPVGQTAGINNEIFGNVLPSIVDDLRTGIYQRCEALLVAMHLDTVAYNRFGIQVSGTWGIPADLKVTPAVPWTDAVNGDPVNDVWNLMLVASTRYGAKFNRATMSTQAFRYMINTAKFQTMARVTVPLLFNYGSRPQADITYQKTVAQNILGLDELELYDARYWSQDEAGNLNSAPYLPINKVILSSTSNDNNPGVQDFANGITAESMLSGLLPNSGTGVIGNFAAGMRGPIAYTSCDPALNPPTLTVWGVMRGFPRRFMLQASAVMTVGTFADSIAIGEPF
jgi:hypothetical protein